MRLGSMSRFGGAPVPFQFGLLPALLGKLLLFPLLLLLLGLVLRLDPLMVQAIALQGAAPTAISLLLIAESEGVDQQRAAGLVFWSTVLALITAPLWGFVLPLLVTMPG
jgi:predicted permease